MVIKTLGPYHVARVSAAGKFCTLLALEVFAQSSEYGWRALQDVHCLRRTLFESEDAPDFTLMEYSRRLGQELSAFEPDVIAVPGWYGADAFQAVDWARHHRIPVVVMSDSQRADFKRVRAKEWLKSRYLMFCQAALVAGSPHRQYLETLGMDASRIWCGYDVVDNAFFATRADHVRADSQRLRKQYSLPERFLLASARFIPKKNLVLLLEAYRIYASDNSSAWNLVILGDGVLRSALEREVTERGLTDKVSMPGFKQYEDLPTFYGLAEAFVVPSISEQWGLVVNEAMASGLPVLVSNRCGCAADLVREGINGYIFDPLLPAALAGLMRRIAADSWERRRTMAEASREIISEWSLELFARNLLLAASCALGAAWRRPARMDVLILKCLAARG